MPVEQWEHDHKGTYSPTGSTVPSLPAAVYEPRTSMSGFHVTRQDLRADPSYHFADAETVINKVLAHAAKFRKNRYRFTEMGLPHQLGVLLHGVPGAGKSVIARLLAQRTVEEGGYAVLTANVGEVRRFLSTVFGGPEVPLLVVFEDFEEIVEAREQEVLQLLDGVLALPPNLMIVATTNHLDKLPPRIRARPSRFSLICEVGAPSEVVRREYLQTVLKATTVAPETVEQMVELSDGFVFDWLRALAVDVYVHDRTVEEAVKTLRELNNLVVAATAAEAEKKDDEEDEDN